MNHASCAGLIAQPNPEVEIRQQISASDISSHSPSYTGSPHLHQTSAASAPQESRCVALD